METMTIDDFSKIDLRIGKITQASFVKDSEKLIKLSVDFGELGTRTIFAGIRKWYTVEDLVERNAVFVFNLEAKKMMGEESQGMLLAAEDEDEENCVILVPDKDIVPGTRVH